MTKHKINDDRFFEAMTKRGWTLDSNNTWITPPGKMRPQMEKEYKEAILEAVECPHEEAGADDAKS